MLRFTQYFTEAKEGSKAGAVANTNGVRHELIKGGVLKHMSTHYENQNPHNGGEPANLFEMNDDELRDHFDKHVANGEFSQKYMPEHYRNEKGQTPKEVHDRYTHETLDPDEHFKHFRNAVLHAKEYHKHLEKRGYDPKSIKNVSWTSVNGNVNSFMKKHGNNPNRKINKATDDGDLMATIKDKEGNTKQLSDSVKWGSQKNAAPTAKNETHRTVAPVQEFSPEHHDAVQEYHNNAQKSVDEHTDRVKSIYAGSEKTRKNAFDVDKRELEKNPNDENLKNKIQTVKDSYQKRSQNVAGHFENMLNKVKNGENGHEEIKNFVRRKLQIANPDFVASRAHMTVDKNNNINGSHFEDHSTSLNDHLNNTHHFDIERNGATVNIHAIGHDGKRLFTHKMWSKHNSRETDGTTKWLHKADLPSSKNESILYNLGIQMSIRKMIEEIFSGKLTESTDSFKRLISEKIQGKLKTCKKVLAKE